MILFVVIWSTLCTLFALFIGLLRGRVVGERDERRRAQAEREAQNGENFL